MTWPALALSLVPLRIPVDLDAEEARRRAVEELAKAKYAGLPDWVGNLVRRMLEWAESIASLLTSAGGGGGFSWALLITVLAVVALIGFVVWKVGLPRRYARRRDAAVGAESDRPPQEYRSIADAAAEQGDWLVAVRERFRAVVRSLEELTVLDARPARTAWEVARTAGRLVPAAQPQLDAAAVLFNDVMYGEVVAADEDYRRLCSWDAGIVAAAGRADLAGAGDPADDPAATFAGRVGR